MSAEGVYQTKRTFGDSFSPEHQNQQLSKTQKSDKSPKMASNDELLAAINNLSHTTTEMQKSLFDVQNTMKDMQSKITDLKTELIGITKKMNERMDKAENIISNHSLQISSNQNEIARLKLSREIVINGIPESKTENVKVIFENICKKLGYNDIFPNVCVRRFKAKQQAEVQKSQINLRFAPIFVEFSFTAEKKQFLETYFKTADLNVSCLGYQSNSRIYVNERLTKHDVNIKTRALALKKQDKLHSVFIMNGRVFVKQAKSSLQIHIDDIKQLDTC